jgi:hypothetical protein
MVAVVEPHRDTLLREGNWRFEASAWSWPSSRISSDYASTVIPRLSEIESWWALFRTLQGRFTRAPQEAIESAWVHLSGSDFSRVINRSGSFGSKWNSSRGSVATALRALKAAILCRTSSSLGLRTDFPVGDSGRNGVRVSRDTPCGIPVPSRSRSQEIVERAYRNLKLTFFREYLHDVPVRARAATQP